MIFASEADLIETVAVHNELVRRCVAGELSFWKFCESYNNFYARFALDGHESDIQERALLEKHAHLIEPHRIIAYDILAKVCADEDAEHPAYKATGRFGSIEAIKRLSNVRVGA